ncbi:MAG: diguanylate cyclase [Tissierellaceae bacterium]|nr:diguanylate cyclase [Tissierellaceae bacterium]
MRIIDNRYKIEDTIDYKVYSESYRVLDLWGNEKSKFLKFYNYDIQKDLIHYLIENFIQLNNINNHKILANESFNLVKSIDAKRINMKLYYSISEYTSAPRLNDIEQDLTLNEKLHIISDICLAMDFLHFRGITYGLLNPSDIFVDENRKIKLLDIANMIEKRMESYYDEFTRYFISPEILVNKNENHKKVDYYSIGLVIKYLLLDNFLEDDVNLFKYKDNSILDNSQKSFLNSVILGLSKRNFAEREANLINIVNEIIDRFSLDYSYNLIENRDILLFKNKIVGRGKEINEILEIDESAAGENTDIKGLVISSDFGMGKTRFLKEISHRLRMKGRAVYSIGIAKNQKNDLLDISNILKQALKDTPTDLIEKYRNELSRILPEMKLSINEDMKTDLNQKSEKFRLYNRIANYFTELSKTEIIYIVIDDIQNANPNLLTVIDYLFKNVKGNNLFFIFSYDKSDKNNYLVKNQMDIWTSIHLIKHIELLKLDLEEIGQMIQNILGISYVPQNLSSVLFRESEGNPRYIEYIIKHLYGDGELFMGTSGKWLLKADSYSDIRFPTNIDDAFEKQLSIIKNNYSEIFKIISIFDGILYKKILLDMTGAPPEKIERELNELIILGLIDEKLADFGYSYSINSNEIKKAIYSEIPNEERIVLHKKAAEVIGKMNTRNMDLVFEEYLFHLIKSNQTDEALEIIFGKLKQVDNKYSTHAKFLWERAYGIEKTVTSLTKLNILYNLISINSLKGETEIGNALLQEYQRDSMTLKDYNHIIKSKSFLIDIYHRKVQIDKEINEINEIEQIAKEKNILEGEIVALISRARLNIDSGKLDIAEEQLKKAKKVSLNSHIKTHLGTIYNRLGIIEFLNGNMEESVKCYGKSIRYFTESGNIADATRPINNLGNIYSGHYDDLKKGMEYYEKGLDIASKFGVQDAEIVFLNNISEIYFENHQYKESIEYIEKVKKGAHELQDISMIFLANVNMAKIYNATSKFDKANELYIYLKNFFDTRQIKNLEITSQYYDFLGEFFGLLGDWKLGIEYSTMAKELCKDFNIKDYLWAETRILFLRFFENGYFNKNKIEELRLEFEKASISLVRRRFLLYFSIISILQGELEYAKELLEEDKSMIVLSQNEYLELVRNSILAFLDTSWDSIDTLNSYRERFLKEDTEFEVLLLTAAIGIKLQQFGQYKLSLKYFFEFLDIAYKNVLKIQDEEMKYSYINSRKIDKIKDRLDLAIEKVFNKEISHIPFDQIRESGIYNYFDITPIIDIIGSEDFVGITQFDYYGEALSINSLEELISKLGDDYKYNLDLILKYLAKETFAKKGYILTYDEINRKYYPISSLDNIFDDSVNDSILNLVNRANKGILINENMCEIQDFNYKEFLPRGVKGIICVPISATEDKVWTEQERRSRLYAEDSNLGYIYLETDNVFNKFDSERMKTVNSSSYLIYTNLENNKLKLMATTDKLTGVYTRKYFDLMFDEFLNRVKTTKGSFSLLMLDIDRFKSVNDTYGHRKGDEVLTLIGKTIKSTIRNDDMVGRYGGEEFIIILKNVSKNESEIIANKLRENITNTSYKGIEYPITVSIGISLFPDQSQFREDLIEKADQALYHAKETGRDKTVVWDLQMTNAASRVDKLSGILTGNSDDDNRRVLALIDIIELVKDKTYLKDKAYIFLSKVLETIDAQYGTIIFVENDLVKNYLTRERLKKGWIATPHLNQSIIENAIKSKVGDYIIDWEYLDNIDTISGLPDWQSIIVVPLIKEQKVKGVLYLSAALRNKEFDFSCYNLAKCYANMFAAII